MNRTKRLREAKMTTIITEDKKYKQSDKLIKAVLDLTKRIEKEGKKSDKPLGAGGFLKAKAGEMAGNVKSMFTAKGVAQLLGKGGDTFIGGLAASITDAKVAKKEEAKAKETKKLETAADWMKYSAEGQDRTNLINAETDKKKRAKMEKEAAALSLEMADQILKLREKIDGLKKEQSAVKSRSGGTLDLNDEKLDELKFYDNAVNKEGGLTVSELDFFKNADKPKQTAAPKTKKKDNGLPFTMKTTSGDKAASITELLEHLYNSTNAGDEAIKGVEGKLGPLSPQQKDGVIRGVKEGMQEELLKLNEEQLAELKKLTKSSEETKKEKKDPKRNLLSALTSKLKAPFSKASGDKPSASNGNAIMSLMSSMGGLASSAASGLSSIAGAGAGALGGLAGTAVRGLGSVALPALAVGGAGAAGYYGAKALGADKLGSWLGGKAADLFQDDPMKIMEERDKQAAALRASKPTTTPREAQSAELAKSIAVAETTAKTNESSKTQSSPTVVNNNISNSKNVTQVNVKPPVRNIEPSLNARLSSLFSF
jgi:hypothetical protein